MDSSDRRSRARDIWQRILTLARNWFIWWLLFALVAAVVQVVLALTPTATRFAEGGAPNLWGLLNFVLAVANIWLAWRTGRLNEKFEREKLRFGRDEIRFRRQLEALDEIVPLVAEPFNLALASGWADGKVLTPSFDVAEFIGRYYRAAAHHYYVLGPRLVELTDDLLNEAWTRFDELSQCADEADFDAKRQEIYELRMRCLKIADDYIEGRIREPTGADAKRGPDALLQTLRRIQAGSVH